MNKFLKIVWFILVVFAFSGCTDDFLNVKNINQLADDNFYQNEEDFKLALNSCYGPMMGGGFYGNQMHKIFGTQDDRILFETPNRDNLVELNSSSSDLTQVWRDLYYGMYRTSFLIKETKAKAEEMGLQKSIEAEARALRAMYYFLGVTIFDKPIFYNENSIPEDYTGNYSNGTPEQFWNQIEEDLKLAIPNLPATYPSSDLGRITSGAANALLGKAMLYKYYYYYARNGQKDSEEAKAALNIARDAFLVIMDGRYKLIQPKAPFSRNDYLFALLSNSAYMDLKAGSNTYKSENNEESIWEVQYISTACSQNGWLPGWMWGGALNVLYFSPHSSSYKNHEVHPNWFYSCDTVGVPAGFTRDPRAYAYTYIDGDTMHIDPTHEYFSKKYSSVLNSKRVAESRGLRPAGQSNRAFGVKKYFFPVFDDAGSNAPMCDPVNQRAIRYADVLLMYAEVQLLLNNDADGTGLKALNDVRGRAGMAGIASLTREAIVHERDVELAFEAIRWFDLVRWSFDSDWNINWDALLGANNFKKGKHEFLPIPLNDIDINNGALKQNPGW